MSTPLLSIASDDLKGLECESYLLVSEDVQTELSKAMSRITERFDIEFISHPEPSASDHYYASFQLNSYECYLPSIHFKNPELALKNLKIFEQKLIEQERLTSLGLSPWPRVLKSDMSIQLYSKNPEPGSVMEWVSMATDRHQVKVLINDEEFKDDRRHFIAFAQKNKVYLPSRFLKYMETSEGKGLLAHELIHAINYSKCGMTLDCGSQIGFHSESLDVLAQKPFEKDSDKDVAYSQFFSSDEVEAYRISGDFEEDPEKKKGLYERAKRFLVIQKDYLEKALKRIEEERISFISQVYPSVTIEHGSHPLEVLLPRLDYYSSSEASELYRDLIKERLKVLDKQWISLRRRLKAL